MDNLNRVDLIQPIAKQHVDAVARHKKHWRMHCEFTQQLKPNAKELTYKLLDRQRIDVSSVRAYYNRACRSVKLAAYPVQLTYMRWAFNAIGVAALIATGLLVYFWFIVSWYLLAIAALFFLGTQLVEDLCEISFYSALGSQSNASP